MMGKRKHKFIQEEPPETPVCPHEEAFNLAVSKLDVNLDYGKRESVIRNLRAYYDAQKKYEVKK